MPPQIHTYMNYSVYVTSDADYAAALSLTGGTLINRSPRAVAGLLGIPFPYPTGDLNTISKTIMFYYPFTPGVEFLNPVGSGIVVDDTVDFQVVPGQPGDPNGIWPAGQDIRYVWTANIIKGNATAGETPSPDFNIPQRRWAEGFEWEYRNADSQGNGWVSQCRDASRTIDGKGFAQRGIVEVTHTPNSFRAITPATSWERFYIRFRQLPSATASFLWRCYGNTVASTGFGLQLSVAGEVRGISIFGGLTDKGLVFTPNLNEWYLVDILIKFEKNVGGVGDYGKIRVFIDHTLAYEFTDNNNGGLNANDYHLTSILGQGVVGDNDIEVDYDDWINSDLPGNCDATTLLMTEFYTLDWMVGSHVSKHFSVNLTPGGWVGNQGVLNRGDNPIATLTNYLSSSTSADQFEALTDALAIGDQPTIAAILGPVAATVGMFSSNVAGTDGKLGYRIAGGAIVDFTVNQVGGGQWDVIGYLPVNGPIPTDFAPFSVVHTKSADANLDKTYAIGLCVEYIGIWGEEDDPALILPYNRLTNLHNCRYENTGWGYFGAVPAAPCFIVGGTYVGNDTFQEIELPAPCHFLWIRAVTGCDEIVMFLGADITAGYGNSDLGIPDMRIYTDSLGVTKFSVSGGHKNLNKAGVTYQVIAFCDPGMRFSLCGEFNHSLNSAVPHTNLLIDPDFTPEVGFARKESGNANAVVALSYKGQAHVGDEASSVEGGVVTNWGSFIQGALISSSDLQIQSNPISYMLFRTAEPGCAGVMIQACSYVGDGNATQVVPITPASGRFPLLVIVIPHNSSEGYMRDPSHVLLESSALTGAANSNNGIRAVDIDQITVGTNLNVNGKTYHVFVFPGSDLGMLNGIYYNPICDPPDTYHIVPNNLDGDVICLMDGGVYIGGDTVSGTPIVAVKDLSGIYTLVLDKHHDSLQDRLPGQALLEYKIPNPFFKTGYLGG